MTDLSDLLVRVEGASGPDRELDAAIWKAVASRSYREAVSAASGLRPRGADLGAWEAAWAPKVAMPYTDSLDAALALVERVLPADVFWNVGVNSVRGRPRYSADIAIGAGVEEAGHTPALAMCTALLRALIASSSDPQPPVSERSDDGNPAQDNPND